LRDEPLKDKLQLLTSAKQLLRFCFRKFRVLVALLAVRDMCGDHNNSLIYKYTEIEVLICR